LLKNGKYVLTSSHFMFATLALRSIKCVNSNLWGIYNFTLLHYGLIAEDCERSRATCFRGFSSIQGVQPVAPLLGSLSSDGLVTAPGAIVFGVIPLFKGLQSEACVPPPCTFGARGHPSKRSIDIELKLYPRRV
jgi:hypothetical protein